MHRYISSRSLSSVKTQLGYFNKRKESIAYLGSALNLCLTKNFSNNSNRSQYDNVNKTNLFLAGSGAALSVYLLWKKWMDQSGEASINNGSLLLPVVYAEETAEPVDVSKLPEIPEHVPYLIVGAGTAAFTAYKAIRAGDAKAKVLMVGEEKYLPYMRPPLSKELWFTDDRKLIDELKVKMWGGKERSLFYEKETFFCSPQELPLKENGGVALLKGHKVVKLDVTAQLAVLDNGATVKYDKCLIATGGKPRSLPIFEAAGEEVQKRTTLFRTIEDFRQLDGVVQSAKSVAIVGGSFLGSELAVGLASRGKNSSLTVIQTFPESGNMGRVLPPYLSDWTTDKVRATGVDVRPKTSVKAVRFDDGAQKVVLTLDNGQTVSVDHVILAVGIEPVTDLAAVSGLEVDPKFGGFLVNAELEARKNIWVAGDVASFYDVKLGRRRVEHHDHAIVSGRLAGENMTGAGKPYWHQSMFWSDLGPEIGYEAIGIIDSNLQTFAAYQQASKEDTPQAASEGAELRSETEAKSSQSSVASSSTGSSDSTYGKGVIFYLRDGYIVGAVMWNIFGKMSIARKLINEDKKFEDLTDVARLFFQPDEKKE